MEATTPESILSRAADLHRRATGEDDYEVIWPLLDEARPSGRRAFEAATALLVSTDPAERAVACDLLGVLCNPDDGRWGAEVATALVGLAEREEDTDVLWSMARALGHARDPRAVTVLDGLVNHPDGDVRFQVAFALPSCEEGADPAVLAGALMRLMEDPDADVRDWATFGLGTQTEIDGPDVREALVLRVVDDNPDVRDEAILGLARRRDGRVAPVVEDRLQEDEVGRLPVEAAAYLADVRLLDPLRALASWWDLDGELLGEALAACDPERQAAAVSDQAELLELLEAGLTGVPGVRAWISCERLDRGVDVAIEREEKVDRYDFEALLRNRGGGVVRAAVDALLSDLSQ